MNSLADLTLVSLSGFGFPVLLFVAFIGSLGIPFPITLVIVAAGALTRQGYLSWYEMISACLLGAAIADHGEYLLGRVGKQWVVNRFGHTKVWQQANFIFNRQGGWAVLLTRFWLTPLAPAINFIAGSHYAYPRFLFFDLLGQLLWVLLYGGLGYIFFEQWRWVSQLVSEFTGISFVVVLLTLAVVGYLKWIKRKKGLITW